MAAERSRGKRREAFYGGRCRCIALGMQSYDTVPAGQELKTVWVDGGLKDAADVTLSLMTHTLHYGVGVFEGIRAYEGAHGPAVFRLREHIERLFASAKMVRMEIPYSVDALCAACTETLAANGLRSGYLRPLVFVDDGQRGLSAMNNRIRVAIMAWPWGAYLGEEGIKDGIRAKVASWTRMTPRSFLPKGKICGQYVNSIMAKREAILSGYDEAILLDDEGFVSEASGENVFIVERGTLLTPPRSSPILAGITRDTVIQIAQSQSLPIEAERFTRSSILCADEVFFTGTAAEVTPVREIDDHTIGNGSRGPLTEQLQAAYFDAVHGRLAGREDWLTPYQV